MTKYGHWELPDGKVWEPLLKDMMVFYNSNGYLSSIIIIMGQLSISEL